MTEERPKLKPMSGATGNRVLILMAWTCALIGLVTIGLEAWTERRLSYAAGFPLFMSTPLGVGALILSLRIIKLEPKQAIFPGVLTSLYWILFVAYY